MPIEWSSESNYKKEMERWNKSRREGGENRRDENLQYPKMLYKAQRHPLSNKYEVAITKDELSLDGTTITLSAERFNATCQKLVNDENEEARHRADGWMPTQAEAMEYVESLAREVAHAAATRAYEDRNMSEKAKAEMALIEEKSGTEHVLCKPEAPRVKRKYTRRAKPAEGAA